jgi:hypothetical protein
MKTIDAPATVLGTVQVVALKGAVDVDRSEKQAAMPSETTTTVNATMTGAFGRDEKRIVI